MGQPNQNIRKMLDQYDIKHCQIAYCIGVNKWTFSRWMSTPLTNDRLKQVYKGIDKLVDDRKNQLDELNYKIKKAYV